MDYLGPNRALRLGVAATEEFGDRHAGLELDRVESHGARSAVRERPDYGLTGSLSEPADAFFKSGDIKAIPLHTTHPVARVTHEMHAGGEIHDALQSDPDDFEARFTVALAREEAAEHGHAAHNLVEREGWCRGRGLVGPRRLAGPGAAGAAAARTAGRWSRLDHASGPSHSPGSAGAARCARVDRLVEQYGWKARTVWLGEPRAVPAVEPVFFDPRFDRRHVEDLVAHRLAIGLYRRTAFAHWRRRAANIAVDLGFIQQRHLLTQLEDSSAKATITS